ncbi:MAG: hypothetical protein RLN61_00015 [Algiphilus sp.]
MIISDLEHLQIVSESRDVEGGNFASARAFADSLARGSFDYYYYYGEGASASTFTETNTFTDYSTAAASSASNSSASTYSGYYY